MLNVFLGIFSQNLVTKNDRYTFFYLKIIDKPSKCKTSVWMHIVHVFLSFKKRACVVDELAACSMKSAYISAICKTFRWGSG